jgi:C1A family cysteine protease
MNHRPCSRGVFSYHEKQTIIRSIPRGLPYFLIIHILLCIVILLMVPVTATPVLNIPVISGDDSGQIRLRPEVQPAIGPSLPNGGAPGVSSGIISPVHEPISGVERCPACSTGDPNLSTTGPESTRITQSQEEEIIAQIQENISRENRDWIAGHTSVSNLTPEAFNRLLGAVPPAEISEISTTQSLPPLSATALPSSFSWRSNGGDYTTPVRDQRSCGSCWAFAGTAVFETFWERLNQNPALNPDFAEQYLVSCSYEDGCGGGWNPLSYFINQPGKSGGVGTVGETAYPYTATDSSCKSLTGYTRYKAPAGTAWYSVAGGSGVPSNDQIKTAVYTYGPLWVALGVDTSFSSYRSGIYSSSYSGSVNHAVALVGWGTTADGRTYWICKNSWGTGWGEGGWFRIYSGSNKIGYAAAYMTNPVLPAPTVSSITPSGAKTESIVPVTNLAGSNFVSGAQVKLTRTGYTNIAATGVSVISSSQITGTMNLAGSAPGSWNVVVTNPDGKSGTLNGGFTVLPNITARFYGVPQAQVFPYTVQFYDASEGNPVSRLWNFGDGGTSTDRNPIHTYTRTGAFTVQLTISDGYGSSSSSA